MGQIRDLTGLKYGRLFIVELDHINRRAYWKCKCDCGKEMVVQGYLLTSGTTISCGCFNKEQTAKSNQKRLSKPVNHNFFSEWSEEMAYVLGFWATDGCLYGNEMSFAQKDESILDFIRMAMQSKHSVYKSGLMYTLRFRSDHIKKDLLNIFGVESLERKSKTILFPFVPIVFLPAFLRGCIDGDGSLQIRGNGTPRIRFGTASRIFMKGFLDSIVEQAGICAKSHKHKEKEFYEVSFGGIKAKCVARWLYGSNEIALERKQQIANQIMQWNPKWIHKKSITTKMMQTFPFIQGYKLV